MNIIVVGAGKVGLTLAEHLSEEHHSVTVVDVSEDALDRAGNHLDVMCVKGNGSSRRVLLEAGAESADVVIAATNSDENNLLCCHCAHRMGVGCTVARVRNADYSGDLENLRSDLGINLLVNPELSAAVEISRLLRFPSAANMDTFCPGPGGAHQPSGCGRGTLWRASSLSALSPPHPGAAHAVLRGGAGGTELVIPDGSFVLPVGDRLYLIGQPCRPDRLLPPAGPPHPQEPQSVFMVGGGRISYYLAGLLERLGMSCKVVEKERRAVPGAQRASAPGHRPVRRRHRPGAAGGGGRARLRRLCGPHRPGRGQPDHLPVRHAAGHPQGGGQVQPAELCRHRPRRGPGQRDLPQDCSPPARSSRWSAACRTPRAA